jgi:CO/xanthine dehydrogenase Mo-binding subunit
MSGAALLGHNLNPSADQIKQALRLNLCRCGGYIKIIEAVQEAGQIMSGKKQPSPRPDYTGPLVGVSVPDKEADEKVSGKLTFADDMYVEGMLYGKVLWTKYPHAEILSIDTSQAETIAGVASILTAKDVPGRKTFGLFVPNHPVLCDTKVRFMGDVLAVAFAESAAQAEAAVSAIKVDYRELEVVGSPQRALEDDVHQQNEQHEHD